MGLLRLTKDLKSRILFECIFLCTATGYGLDGRGSFLDGVQNFLYSTASRPSMAPNKSSIQWVTGAVSPGVKAPRREPDSSLLSSAEVKNGGTIPPPPRTSLWRGAL
jgi:hypothetical protein